MKEFYVDLDALIDYSETLKRKVQQLNDYLANLKKANVEYQQSLVDSISEEVNENIKRLKRIFDALLEETLKVSKDVKEAYETYQIYLRKLN